MPLHGELTRPLFYFSRVANVPHTGRTRFHCSICPANHISLDSPLSAPCQSLRLFQYLTCLTRIRLSRHFLLTSSHRSRYISMGSRDAEGLWDVYGVHILLGTSPRGRDSPGAQHAVLHEDLQAKASHVAVTSHQETDTVPRDQINDNLVLSQALAPT